MSINPDNWQEDFAVFVITHGRPDSLITTKTIREAGYTGKIYYLVDNEDLAADRYRSRLGESVIVFDKKQIADKTDEGDNFNDRRTTTHARNASYDIARQLGITYFVQLDDDYTNFSFRTNHEGQYPVDRFKVRTTLDGIFAAVLRYYKKIPAACIALAQGGDFIGGHECEAAKTARPKRKCMNSFFCSVDRRVWFLSRMNEDVNTYVTLGSRGVLFLTIPLVNLDQLATQSNQSGMTDVYKKYGTYVKSFYTVMYAPSCTKISMMNTRHSRIHHAIEWANAVPVILRDEYRSKSYGHS